MIYVTGDTHCPIDMRKLNTKNFPEQKNLTKDDTLIICGDFGAVWDGSKEDLYWQKWLNNKNMTVVFCDGNHENFDLLQQYPQRLWNGGWVREIQPSLLYLMRGECYTIEDKTFFVLGGADSHDKEYRTEGKTWWRQERPDAIELDNARGTLDSLEWKVDYVITHTAPRRAMCDFGYDIEDSEFQDFLDEMSVCLEFKKWYFGHFHRDMNIGSNYVAVYSKILEIK